MAGRVALMSIRPRFADLVLAGKKTVELRRGPVGLTPGDLVYVYASGPVMAVRGSFIVAGVARKPLRALWEIVRHRAQVTRSEFDDYFIGMKEGVAIEIESARSEPDVSLEDLRKHWPGFHPPQTYRYLTESELVLMPGVAAKRPNSSAPASRKIRLRGFNAAAYRSK